MEKSPDAFRTISEVAELLETPAHVLRFWESRFPQIRPVKRAGGRRYYRPADVALLTGIKRLLHDEGMTIRGVQKILREQGVRFVSGMADETTAEDDDAALVAALAESSGPKKEAEPLPPVEAETAQVIALQSALAERTADAEPDETLGEEPPTEEGATVSEAASPAPNLVGDPQTARTGDARPKDAENQETGRPTTRQAAWQRPPRQGAPAEEDLFSRQMKADETESLPDKPPALEREMEEDTAAGEEDVETIFFTAEEPDKVPPTPLDEVEEAPMAVWAEEEDVANTPASDSGSTVPPALKVTRIGAPASPVTAAPHAPMVPQPGAGSAPVDHTPSGETLATRLRRTDPARLSPSDRSAVTLLRARARSLRDRLAANIRAAH